MLKFDQKEIMITKAEILDYLETKKADLESEFQVTKIGLFGSYAREEQTENSDIDLLIEFAPGTKSLSDKKDKIRSMFKAQFQREVDLCREKYIKPYFRSQILQSAIYV